MKEDEENYLKSKNSKIPTEEIFFVKVVPGKIYLKYIKRQHAIIDPPKNNNHPCPPNSHYLQEEGLYLPYDQRTADH